MRAKIQDLWGWEAGVLIAALPLAAWVLVYCFEVGQFVAAGVPLIFVDITITYVIATSLLLLGVTFTWLPHLGGNSARLPRFLLGIGMVAGAFITLWLSSGRPAIAMTVGLGAMFFSLWALLDVSVLRLVMAPAFRSMFLGLMVVVLVGGVGALGYGIRQAKTEVTVVDISCGTLPELWRRIGESLLIVNTSAAGPLPSLHLLGVSDTKGLRFRRARVEEVAFRRVEMGPCFPNRAAREAFGDSLL